MRETPNPSFKRTANGLRPSPAAQVNRLGVKVKSLLVLLCVVLGGCVLMTFSTDVDLVKVNSGSEWFLYITEPTSKMAFAGHTLIPAVGNVSNSYRIAIPQRSGRMEASALVAFLGRGSDYTTPIEISGGHVAIEGCLVEIDLWSKDQPLSFNGAYQLPGWTCKEP